MTIKPRKIVPALDIPMVDGGRFRLAERKPGTFFLLVAYRGYHCPICKTYLRDLQRKLPDFAGRGVDVLAFSTDDEARARRTRDEWELPELALGYGLGIEEARSWGLFVSTGIKESEPPMFAEPGLFLVRPDLTLYAASVQTMPFARPGFADVLNAVEFVTKNNYPARGEA